MATGFRHFAMQFAGDSLVVDSLAVDSLLVNSLARESTIVDSLHSQKFRHCSVQWNRVSFRNLWPDECNLHLE